MPFSLKDHEADARERLRAFWAGSSLGRPCLDVQVDVPEAPRPNPFSTLSVYERDLLPEYHAWAMADAVRQTRFLAEAMPGFHVAWGSFLTTLAVAVGGTYTYHESAWILPIPDLYARPLPVFDPLQPFIVTLDACYLAAQGALGNQGFLTPPLMMDGLSTLSMFRGADQLCLDLLDQPDTVRQWSAALTTLYIDIYEHYYRLLGTGDTLCFFGPLAEGCSEGVQCDFAVNLSPAMYEDFVYPDLRRVTDYFDYSLYHLDGTCQLRFLDHLRAMPKLNGIQWNPEVTAGSQVAWLDAFRDIRRRGFSLMINASVEEAVHITRALGPDGLFFRLPRFSSVVEAEAAIVVIEEAC